MLWRSSPPARLARLIVACACVAAVASLAITGVTTAHSSLVASEPADGEERAGSPVELRLRFDGPVDASLAEIRIADQAGRPVAIGPLRVDRFVELVAPLPPLGRGIYRVQWRIASSVDLHEIGGTIVFGIDRWPVGIAMPQGGRWPSPLSAASRGIELVGFALLVGALALMRLIGGRVSGLRAPLLPAPAARRLRILLVAGTAATVAGGGARLAIAAAGLPGGPERLAAAAPLVGWWLVESLIAGALALFAFVVWREPRRRASDERHAANRRRHDRVADLLVTGLVAAGAVTLAAPTHLGGLGPAGTALAAIHLVAGAVWVGGLAGLAVTVPAIRAAHASVASVVRRFALLAIPAATALGISGLLAAGTLVPSPVVLVGPYGAILGLKLLLAGGLAAIGLRNAAATHEFAQAILERARAAVNAAVGLRARVPRIRIAVPWIRFELAAGCAVLLAASALGATSAAPPPTRIPTVAASTARAADLVVGIEVRPLRSGPNFVSVTILDTRRPQPAPVESVDVEMAYGGGGGVSTMPAARLDGGQWEVATSLPRTGDWTATIVVHRAGLPDAQVTMGWVVPEPPATTNARPFLVPAAIGAGALGTMIAVAVYASRARRRRQTRTVAPAILEPVSAGPSTTGR
jgi:copper transport protein